MYRIEYRTKNNNQQQNDQQQWRIKQNTENNNNYQNNNNINNNIHIRYSFVYDRWVRVQHWCELCRYGLEHSQAANCDANGDEMMPKRWRWRRRSAVVCRIRDHLHASAKLKTKTLSFNFNRIKTKWRRTKREEKHSTIFRSSLVSRSVVGMFVYKRAGSWNE